VEGDATPKKERKALKAEFEAIVRPNLTSFSVLDPNYLLKLLVLQKSKRISLLVKTKVEKHLSIIVK
jgi:hypothetical protein